MLTWIDSENMGSKAYSYYEITVEITKSQLKSRDFEISYKELCVANPSIQ